ncbi:MAG: thioredoxin family protein [Thermotogota bacterium]|nr:thioredoxin family protein [Thermotogota bacterium]
MMKKVFCLSLWALLPLTICALNFTDYVVYNDIENGMKAAVLLEKSVLIVFTLPGCSTCEQLKTEALSNPSLAALLKEQCIVIVAEAEKDHYAKYPFRTYADSTNTSFETVNYYDLITKKIGSKIVPYTMFFNPRLEMIGSTQSYSGFESYEAAVKKFIKLNARNPKNILKTITASEKTLLLNTLPFSQTIAWDDFKEAVDTLDRQNVYILDGVKIAEARALLDTLSMPPAHVLISSR